MIILLGFDKLGGRDCAIKLTKQDSVLLTMDPQYKALKKFRGGKTFVEIRIDFPLVSGIPELKWSGSWKDSSIFVMDLQGKTLKNIFKNFKNQFKIPSVCIIAYQLVLTSWCTV